MFQCAIFGVKNGFLHGAAGTVGAQDYTNS